MDIKKEEYQEYLTEDYLSFKEAALLLEISEDELRELAQKHSIQTHQVAGAFLRLKRKEVELLKNKWRIERDLFPRTQGFFEHESTIRKASFFDNVKDFWYFNDFYILCSTLIALLLYFILATQY